MIVLACPSCGKRAEVPDSWATREEKCVCGEVLEVERPRPEPRQPGRSAPPPREDLGAPADPELGKVLFQRTKSSEQAYLFVASAIGGIVFTIAALGREDMRVVSIVPGLFALIFIVAAARTFGNTFRCHEHGAYHGTLFGEQRLKYVDVETFTYHTVRVLLNGVKSAWSLTIVVTLEPFYGRGEKMYFFVEWSKPDPQLEGVRDHISKIIAMRMAESLNQGEPVKWTPHLWLLPTGIRFPHAGSGQPRTLSFDQVDRYDFKEGVFYLWKRGTQEPAIAESMSEPNFFPGFILLLTQIGSEKRD